MNYPLYILQYHKTAQNFIFKDWSCWFQNNNFYSKTNLWWVERLYSRTEKIKLSILSIYQKQDYLDLVGRNYNVITLWVDSFVLTRCLFENVPMDPKSCRKIRGISYPNVFPLYWFPELLSHKKHSKAKAHESTHFFPAELSVCGLTSGPASSCKYVRNTLPVYKYGRSPIC